MAEYIERKRAIVDACNSLELYPSEYAKLEDALNKISAADVVPVVRCRDCKHFMEYTREYAQTTEGADGDCYIKLINSEDKQYFACTYDDFCSYGERKEGAE